jgi:hypothetical protein
MPLYLFHMNVTTPFVPYNFVFLKNVFNLSRLYLNRGLVDILFALLQVGAGIVQSV